MNRQKISEMSGQQVNFWPPTRRFDSWGQELPPMDDTYVITEADRQHVTVRNTRTDHQFPINNDHIHEFLSHSTGRSRGVTSSSRVRSFFSTEARGLSRCPVNQASEGTLSRTAQLPRQCLFCANNANSKEHAMPMWILNLRKDRGWGSDPTLRGGLASRDHCQRAGKD